MEPRRSLVKRLVQKALQATLEWSLSVVFGVVVLCRLVWAWCRGRVVKGSMLERIAPPDCLQDPSLGSHRSIRIKNHKLHYVESGHPDNPLVVMIHGTPDFWFTWRKQIPTLSNDYRVVAVDLRGCGDSDTLRSRCHYTIPILAHDIATLISLIGSESAHLVCAGGGGQVGWYMCYHYPQLVKKMVLIHSPHPYVIRQHLHSSWHHYWKAWFVFFVRLPFLPEFAAHANDRGLVDHQLGGLLKGGAILKEEVEAYKYTFSRREDWTGPMHHLRSLDLGRVWEGEEGQPDVITKPTLLLMGDADPLLPLDTAYRSAEYVERITVKPIPGPGHLCHQSRPHQVNQAVGEFLRELPWRPLSPLTPETPYSSSSSLVGRVMGASLGAVSNTVGRYLPPKATETLEKTASLPTNLLTAAQVSFKVAESTFGLDYLY
ncbi:hypothetical protein Pcinc_033785 [Petrolisthes cinctipes]|uniref:AB hydrolase-1 domain-containing protein n=1 Tax=Petrolisthes cinctipes TaxID=88211 RepID=A0AAE1ERL5_PETCI|nr:hypothetical protein Pcinc_033785 [Petrolisthes cinctipes]